MVVAALALAGCVSSEVTPIGPARASRPENCPLSVYPTTRPAYGYEEIASVRAECDRVVGRDACVIELRRRACAAGADTVFGFSEGNVGAGAYFIAATVAVRSDAESPSAAADACVPICSPGFTCQVGKCIPQCNPACEAGEICNRKRLCESAAGSAGSQGASLSL